MGLSIVMIQRSVRKFPLVGGLADAEIRHHRDALAEVSLNVALSTIPVWLGAFLMLADKSVDAEWFALLVRNVRDGELFLYSTAMLGPLYYFIFTEYRDMPNFPNSRMFIAISTVLLLICVGLFSLQRAEALFVESERIDKAFVFLLSWKIYIASIAVVYLAYVYKHVRESAATFMGEDTRRFVQEWKDRGR